MIDGDWLAQRAAGRITLKPTNATDGVVENTHVSEINKKPMEHTMQLDTAKINLYSTVGKIASSKRSDKET